MRVVVAAPPAFRVAIDIGADAPLGLEVKRAVLDAALDSSSCESAFFAAQRRSHRVPPRFSSTIWLTHLYFTPSRETTTTRGSPAPGAGDDDPLVGEPLSKLAGQHGPLRASRRHERVNHGRRFVQGGAGLMELPPTVRSPSGSMYAIPEVVLARGASTPTTAVFAAFKYATGYGVLEAPPQQSTARAPDFAHIVP
jgi:hypothetical protein